MKDLEGAVAVITGAAGGIGYACAEEAVRRGMRVVVADLREEPLNEARERLGALGGTVVAAVTDVTSARQVEQLAAVAKKSFGGTNLLINSAGMFASGLSWNVSEEMFETAVRTNLFSVVNATRSFVPGMITSGEPCHVVNIASSAGLASGPGTCMYSATKHAVVAFTEALAFDLMTHQIGTVGVTLVMPGYIQSDIMNPSKVTASESVRDQLDHRLDDPVCAGLEQMMRAGVEAGLPAADAAAQIFDAIRDNHFYLLPNAAETLDAARSVASARIDGAATLPFNLG